MTTSPPRIDPVTWGILFVEFDVAVDFRDDINATLFGEADLGHSADGRRFYARGSPRHARGVHKVTLSALPPRRVTGAEHPHHHHDSAHEQRGDDNHTHAEFDDSIVHISIIPRQACQTMLRGQVFVSIGYAGPPFSAFPSASTLTEPSRLQYHDTRPHTSARRRTRRTPSRQSRHDVQARGDRKDRHDGVPRTRKARGRSGRRRRRTITPIDTTMKATSVPIDTRSHRFDSGTNPGEEPHSQGHDEDREIGRVGARVHAGEDLRQQSVAPDGEEDARLPEQRHERDGEDRDHCAGGEHGRRPVAPTTSCRIIASPASSARGRRSPATAGCRGPPRPRRRRRR